MSVQILLKGRPKFWIPFNWPFYCFGYTFSPCRCTSQNSPAPCEPIFVLVPRSIPPKVSQLSPLCTHNLGAMEFLSSPRLGSYALKLSQKLLVQIWHTYNSANFLPIEEPFALVVDRYSEWVSRFCELIRNFTVTTTQVSCHLKPLNDNRPISQAGPRYCDLMRGLDSNPPAARITALGVMRRASSARLADTDIHAPLSGSTLNLRAAVENKTSTPCAFGAR